MLHSRSAWPILLPVLLITPLVCGGLSWSVARLAPRWTSAQAQAHEQRPPEARDLPSSLSETQEKNASAFLLPEAPASLPPEAPVVPGPPVVPHSTPATLSPAEPLRWKPLQPRASLPSARSDLPAELQQQVNQAIQRGVTYLSKRQRDDGRWSRSDYPLAMTALGGLTLLEAGVPAPDERVQRAAHYIRERVLQDKHSTHTYTLSLVVLFLDALQASEDRPLLRSLALRLLAGQQSDGGWSYNVPKLTPTEEKQLLHALTRVRPPELATLFRTLEESRSLQRITDKPGSTVAAPVLQQITDQPTSDALPSDARQAVALLPEPLRQLPGLNEVAEATLPSPEPRKDTRPVARPAGGRKLLNKDNAGPAKALKKLPWKHTDNSNTQFALLALWAALRHGVPSEHALRLAGQRFESSQLSSGRWGYRPSEHEGTPAMTGVGLLGLGLRQGLSGTLNNPLLQEPQIQRGLAALGKMIGRHEANNLYFLWTLERVGVLYGLNYIHRRERLVPPRRRYPSAASERGRALALGRISRQQSGIGHLFCLAHTQANELGSRVDPNAQGAYDTGALNLTQVVGPAAEPFPSIGPVPQWVQCICSAPTHKQNSQPPPSNKKP